MFTFWEIAVLAVVATLGHVMALIWYLAARYKWKLCECAIYELPISEEQIRRETRNSLHAPIHAVLLAAFLWLGFFNNTGWVSFWLTGIGTAIWAEVWHYLSHRAFHIRQLHWIHAEHHRSHVNSWMTAISFSFSEKVIFDFGLLLPMALTDYVLRLNFFGVAAWYVGYLVINSFSHANFEIRPAHYNKFLGKWLTTTTYHSLHHSRYTGNYGLGLRILDRMFKTEWPDYEAVYDRICGKRTPLKGLRQKLEGDLEQTWSSARGA